MKSIIFQHTLFIISKNIWVGVGVFVFILINLFPLDRSNLNTSAPVEGTLVALKHFATEVFTIDDLGNNGCDAKQADIAMPANTSFTAGPEFIVSCSGHSAVYGEQSMNAPFGLQYFKNLFNDPSPQVHCYPVFANNRTDANMTDDLGYKQHYYTVVKQIGDSVSARFIFLDTPSLISENNSILNTFKNTTINEGKAQMEWFREVLQNAGEKWIFVIGHHPICTADPKNSNNQEFIAKIKPLLDQYKVDFYLSASGYNFEHSQPKRSFVEYIASGEGNFGTSEAGINQDALFNSSIPGFTLISISKSLLEIYYVTAKGNVIYSLKRKKGNC